MNEQLIVKNFGPIKDATVDFKRVTVFIGPTGGGKSTLAKLAAMFNTQIKYHGPIHPNNLKSFNTRSYWTDESRITWRTKQYNNIDNNTKDGQTIISLLNIENNDNDVIMWIDEHQETLKEKIAESAKTDRNTKFRLERLMNEVEVEDYLSAIEMDLLNILKKLTVIRDIYYLPAERVFLPAMEYSWARNIWEDIGLPKFMRFFGNNFSSARDSIKEMPIGFLNTTYKYHNGQDYVKIAESDTLLRLYEAASGFQSIIPLLVLLEYLSRNTGQAQSFIIEEPELNLYPTAQRDLVYWLLQKCTQGDNDLTVTTHSPYVLSALNLALYAGKVATLFPHQRQKVAKIIPEKCWLKADEFSAYHVAGGYVKSIFDNKTGLLSESQLDEVSGHFADVFDQLTNLRVPEKKAPAKAKPAKK